MFCGRCLQKKSKTDVAIPQTQSTNSFYSIRAVSKAELQLLVYT